MLGDISPQTVRITQQAVVYPSRDHVTSLRVERFDGRTYKPVDMTAVTRVILSFPEADPVIVYDSSVQAVFTHVGATLTVDLSDYAMPASVLGCQIILYDAEHQAGQVLVDDIDAVVQFDFRNVSATGGTPPPAVEYITDAPVDGVTYARKDGVWAIVGAAGGGGAVDSVNGQTGVVVLDAADVGADSAGAATTAAAAAVAAHTALADPHPQYLTPAEGNAAYDALGAAASAVGTHVAAADPHTQYTTVAEAAAAAPVQSVNTQTGAVVLDAADVGADAAGTAAAAVSAHEADTTPHAVITQVDKFGFDTAAGMTAGVGEMVWNAAAGTADLGLPGGVTLQVGQEQLIRVLNKTGSTIQNMHVVYITGAQGQRVTAAQAQANSASADKTLAVATQDIANNAEGFATILGMVRQVNTSAWAEGTELWLSAATPGAITNVRPSAPNHQVRVGYVVRSHATAGVIYVKVNVGSDLNHLHDVVITAPVDNDVLIYDSATQTWQNGPQTGGSGEVNTASNLGSGAGVFASKVGADLQFKSLIAGAGVTLTPTATGITIVASGAGGAVDSVNGQTGVVVLDTDDISEGAANLYFTTGRAAAAAPVQSVDGQTGAVDLSGSYAPLSHVGSGGAAHANVVAGGAAGFMTGADKDKLDDIAAGATANANTDSLTEGTTNLYFTEPRVRATPLTGLSTATTGAVAATDTVLEAFGKLEKTKAPLASPTFTGSPAAPTASPGDNTTKLATTAFVAAAVAAAGGGVSLAVVQALTSSRSLALADINTFNVNSTTNNYTASIPAQATVAWTADAEMHFLPSSTGDIVITADAGVSLNGVVAGSLTLGTQNGAASLKRIAADSWWLGGVIDGSAPITSVTGTAPIVSSGGTTPAISITAATTSAAGSMSAADKTKLDGIEAGAQVNVATDLSLGTITTTTIPINSSTGTDITLPSATTSLAGLQSAADKTKLNGAAVLASAQTFTAVQTFGAAVRENAVAVAASNIDLALGGVYSKTISGATTFTLSNVPTTGIVPAFILMLTNGGSATVTWWSGIKWPGGTPPTLTASGLDALGFYSIDGGTSWVGLVLGKALA